MELPADNFILLSLINTKLRDGYLSLSDLCDGEEIDVDYLTDCLAAAGYRYFEEENAFKSF